MKSKDFLSFLQCNSIIQQEIGESPKNHQYGGLKHKFKFLNQDIEFSLIKSVVLNYFKHNGFSPSLASHACTTSFATVDFVYTVGFSKVIAATKPCGQISQSLEHRWTCRQRNASSTLWINSEIFVLFSAVHRPNWQCNNPGRNSSQQALQLAKNSILSSRPYLSDVQVYQSRRQTCLVSVFHPSGD